MRNQQRYLSLDILKGIGIIYLIFTHQIIWLYIKGDAGGLIYPESLPIFYFFRTGFHVLGYQIPLLAGVTFFLTLKLKVMSAATLIKRAFLLAALGYLMNLLAWGPYDLWDFFDWDVLQFIALSMIVTYPIIKKLSTRWSAAILFLLGAIAIYLSDQFPYPDFQELYFYKIIIGDTLGEHYWPFFPWFGIFASGVLIGMLLIENDKRKLMIMAGIGFIMVLHSSYSGNFTPTENFDNTWGTALFKPSPYFVTGIIGGSLLWIVLMQFLFERFSSLKRFFEKSIFVYYGTGILWIYILTTIIGYHITTIARYQFRPNFKESLVLFPILILMNLAVGYIIGKFTTDRKKITYSAES